MTLDDAVIARHTVKAFEGGKTLPQEQIETLLNVLQNSPSSVNSQPWHFVVASTTEGRAAIAKSTTGAFNLVLIAAIMARSEASGAAVSTTRSPLRPSS